ncbi:MAG: phage tail tape measure protein [Bacteroidales bacterium]|nr:phage tail tape measure protein [Bacteroidales bacterium]
MANPITHNDIIENGNPFTAAIAGAEELRKKLLEIQTGVMLQIKEATNRLKNLNPTTTDGQNGITRGAEDMAKMQAVIFRLNKEIAELTAKQNTLTNAAKNYGQAVNGLSQDQKNQIKLAGLQAKENAALAGSYARISAAMSRAKFEQKNFHQIGSEGYKKLNNEIKGYDTQLKKLDASHGVFGRSVGHYATAIRNAWTIIGGAVLTVGYTLKKWVMFNAELSDSMAAVRRTTGMTQREVYDLNETLRGLDTRTSQASLLDLAHVAGKLGIAKNEIAGFVKAADMIGVALGKDLGNNEEAINQLGRIVQIFKTDANGIGMERALLKVGSALKDLGNASVAEEENIIDFTKRMGGLSQVTDVSVDKIMGLGATMDILGQTMEVASTSVNQIWIAMAQKPEKYAEIAQMAVQDFKKLMAKDFNEAFIAVAKGMDNSGASFSKFAEQFKDLGLDGRRTIGVMAVLSGNIELYRKQIDIAKQSLDAGTTAAKQYTIQNETLGASFDKAGKAIVNFAANSGVLSVLQFVVNSLAASFNRLSGAALGLPGLEYKTAANDPDRVHFAKSELLLKNQKQMLANYQKKWGVSGEEAGVANEDRVKRRIKVLQTEIAFTEKAIELDKLRTKNQRDIQELKDKNKLDSLQNINPDGTPKTKAEIALEKQLAREQEKIIKEQQKADEAYYQFKKDLANLTINEIVEHERSKLEESGAWDKASYTEQQEWYRKTRTEATQSYLKEMIDSVTLDYDNQIKLAKENGKETFGIEENKYQTLLALMDQYGLQSTDEYKKIQQDLLELDADYSKKTIDEKEKFWKEVRELERENTKRNNKNRLTEIDTSIAKIENEKIPGKRGVAGTDLTPEAIQELKRLYKERDDIIDASTASDVAILQQQIDNIDKWRESTLAAFGYLPPEMEALLMAQRNRLSGQIAETQSSGESKKTKGQGKENKSTTGMSPIARFFEPEQWQKDMAIIVAETQKFADQVNSILGSISQKYQQNMDAELAATEAKYQGEFDALDASVKNKTMSEQAAADKKAKLEKKQKAEALQIEKTYKKKQQEIAVAQAWINIALGVTSAIASAGDIYTGIALAAGVLVTGLYEIGVIESQKFEKGGSGVVDKKKGGVLQGKRHSQGGVHIPGIGEAEQGEYFAIINREATKKYSDQLPVLFDAINGQRYEQMFSKRGMSPSVTVNVPDKYSKDVLKALNKPETKVYNEGNFTVYETGNYRLKTSRQ